MSNALTLVPVTCTVPAGLVKATFMLRFALELEQLAVFGKSRTVPDRKVSSAGLDWSLAKLKFVIAK